jgi:uncharacterized protein (TIGR02270 family)
MAPTPDSTRAFDNLVDESLDESAFLWRRWERELVSLTRNLDEVWSWTEDRLHGALDGVRAAGPRLVDVGSSALASDDTTTVSVGAALLGSSADPAAVEAVVSALRTADGQKLDAIGRGLELLGASPVLRAAAAMLVEARTPACAAMLCRLKAFRRVAPGNEIVSAFESGDVSAQVAAVRAAQHLPPNAAEGWIVRGLDSEDAVVRRAAVEAGVRRGMARAWRMVGAYAAAPDESAGPYLNLLALLGTADDHDLIYAALRVPPLQRHAVHALGHVGTVRAADVCLAGMAHEAIARACGEAYCWITGAELERDRLAKEESLPDVPAFEDDDLDANLVPPPETLWPLPDVDAVRRHWEARRRTMDAAARHVRGVVASDEGLAAAIETGPMLRRSDLVLDLGARTKGRYDVETRAFASRQRQMMSAGRAALTSGRER